MDCVESSLFEESWMSLGSLGEDDTGTFTYLLKAYADAYNLISEALHKF